MSEISLETQIACVVRELKIRESVYPQWVRSGRMKAETAAEEIERMQAVLATLRSLQAGVTANDYRSKVRRLN